MNVTLAKLREFAEEAAGIGGTTKVTAKRDFCHRNALAE